MEEISFKEDKNRILKDLSRLGDDKFFYHYPVFKNENLRQGNPNKIDISIQISIFVTAYARIHINKYKLEYSNHLYFSDTDSMFLDLPLPSNLVNKELGNFKLENIANEAVFLAPKVYGLLLSENSEVIKFKGSKILPSFDAMKYSDFNNTPLSMPQARFKRNEQQGIVEIITLPYNTMLTENKRIFIRNNKGIVIDTQPLTINE
jgi:hypothetical protein